MNNTFYAPNDYRSYLTHHGVKGMKWGVRRYQNYDGSYTQAGVKRFRDTQSRYEHANAIHKIAKESYKSGFATKNVVKEAKREKKDALKDLKKDYKRLKNDKLGDQGKQLYAEGKTITGNNTATQAIATGTSIVSYLLYKSGRQKESVAALIGGTAVVIGKQVVDGYRNRRLRAFYGHGQNWSGSKEKNDKYWNRYGGRKANSEYINRDWDNEELVVNADKIRQYGRH